MPKSKENKTTDLMMWKSNYSGKLEMKERRNKVRTMLTMHLLIRTKRTVSRDQTNAVSPLTPLLLK